MTYNLLIVWAQVTVQAVASVWRLCKEFDDANPSDSEPHYERMFCIVSNQYSWQSHYATQELLPTLEGVLRFPQKSTKKIMSKYHSLDWLVDGLYADQILSWPVKKIFCTLFWWCFNIDCATAPNAWKLL